MNKIAQLGNQIVDKYRLQKQKIIIAVSTGVDSTVLLNALIASDLIDNSQLIVAHVNHQLREQSDEEERFLKQWCDDRNLLFQSCRWDKLLHPQNGIEAAAREFRYQFFDQLMHKYRVDYVLTAHNANEQAESFLMQLIRGGQLNQLAGIPERRKLGNGWVLRPFLKISKTKLIELAQDYKLQWFEDASNLDEDYLRNRIRHQVMPLLQEENDRFLEHVGNYQKQLIEQNQLLDSVTEEKLNRLTDTKDGYNLQQIREYSLDWQKVLISKMIQRINPQIPIQENKMEEILRFINHFQDSQGYLDLGNQYQLLITYNSLSIQEKRLIKTEQSKSHMVTLNEWTKLDKQSYFKISNQKTHTKGDLSLMLSANQFDWPVRIRPAQPNDRIRLKDGHFKTVRRELIDQKIPNYLRQSYYSVVDNSGLILWVPGLRKAWLAKPLLQAQELYIMDFRTGGCPNGQ